MATIRTLFVLFFFVLNSYAQVSGCTDPLSTNYNAQATVNNGSCNYPSATISPVSSVTLPSALNETSGLIKWGNYLYSHNDNTNINLYALDSISGTIAQSLPVTGVANQDWEEISQDDSYLYIGDFGNNNSGNRTNLRIIKVEKASLAAGNPVTTNINFSYSDQQPPVAADANKTDYDCEAFVVTNDSIYLFTKQWSAKKTSLYALPKTPGTHIAQLKTTYNVNGLITGAAIVPGKNIILLCGYSPLLQPFLYLLYDYSGNNFFSGNKRKVGVSLGFHQIEGITTANGLDYFATNEHFVQAPFVNVPQKLHRINLAPYLQNYIENNTLGTVHNEVRSMIRVYPNPAGDVLFIDVDPGLSGTGYSLFDTNARDAQSGMLTAGLNKINISSLASGIYTIKISYYPDYSYRLVKL